ncbi:DUF3261 domain-containing protein [Microvirgula aerodenitrificans]|uniref:DUF3261 domain-containing protein n=1 Tax=Microvirgula aerodenitrificans TaxID=57480 RepID=UPI0028EDA6AF|nr:DUF3261 domain-containing protein [Microvirgula aerodenitrificans]
MRRVNRWGCCGVLCLLLLTGCATRAPAPVAAVPPLQLAPATLGSSLTLVQRLTVLKVPRNGGEAASTGRSIDVLLELDPARVRLAGFVMNQRVLTLDYDGKTLRSQRHPLLPMEVDAAHVLRDVQLVYWPASALQAALPPGWTLDESERARVLRSRDGRAVVNIRYAASAPRWIGTAELDNVAEHYRLRIESALQPEEAP